MEKFADLWLADGSPLEAPFWDFTGIPSIAVSLQNTPRTRPKVSFEIPREFFMRFFREFIWDSYRNSIWDSPRSSVPSARSPWIRSQISSEFPSCSWVDSPSGFFHKFLGVSSVFPLPGLCPFKLETTSMNSFGNPSETPRNFYRKSYKKSSLDFSNSFFWNEMKDFSGISQRNSWKIGISERITWEIPEKKIREDLLAQSCYKSFLRNC